MSASIAQLGNVLDKNKTATQRTLDAAKAAGYVVQQVWGVGGGDHAGGLATDFMVYGNKAMGDWIADWLWANRGALGVRWIIWQQRIRSTSPGKPGTWQAMEDRGSPTANHMDHVHVMWTANPVTAAVAAGVSVVKQVAQAAAGTPANAVRLANVRLGNRNEDCRRFNKLLWAKQGWAYKAANLRAWMSEPSDMFGPVAERVLRETYAYWARTDPSMRPVPTHPAWPGEHLLRALGGVPR